jgi:ribonucleoside-diphosphate reductase alpha chain
MLTIEKVNYQEDVFDITVEDNHNFFANDILVHNCTEIFLHTKPSKYEEGEKKEVGEAAVCNLSSVNLKEHLKNGKLDYPLLAKTIATQIRALDSVIDLNFYPTKEAANSNLKHRPVGAGSMGWADVFHAYKIDFSSEEAIQFSDELQEFISYHCILNSCALAKEKGKYSTYNNSLWSKGVLPIDTYKSLMNYLKQDPIEFKSNKFSPKVDWDTLRASIKEHGVRNSNTMAIAPTATISYIQGCSPCIEPDFSTLFVYENKSGNLMITNEWFVNECKELGIWNKSLIEMIKSVDGDLSQLNGYIPDDLKKRYCTAFDRDQFKLVDAAAARQKWIDMGQSLNLFNSNTSLKFLNDLYIHARNRGLKATYYLRNKSASKIEKSVTKTPETNNSEPKACSILNPGCESCQ